MYLLQLARIYESSGQYEKAETFYKAPFRLPNNLGPSHPDTASALNNLAGMYDRKAEYDKSEADIPPRVEDFRTVARPLNRI